MIDTKPLPVFNNRHLRFVFVAFLFSAAIADTGRAAVKVFTHWPFFLPAATHLGVAFIAISTSWVYWARNIGDGPQLKDIFSREYLLLVLDLMLVIIYIGVAETVELPRADPRAALPTPSAVPESLLLSLAYFVYFVWDLVHDVYARHRTAAQAPPAATVATEAEAEAEAGADAAADLAPLPPTLAQILQAAVVRSAASLICCLLALLIVVTARGASARSTLGVCLLNLAELGNLLLFRSLKAAEYQYDSSLHPAYRENEDRYADVRARMRVCTIVSSAVYATALFYVRAL